MEGVENIEQKPTRGAHVLVIPTNLQGHINPMLQFSKRLSSKGLQVTFILTSSIPCQSPLSSLPSIEFVRIFDGFREDHKVVDLDAHVKRLKACITQSMLDLIHYYKQNKESLSPTPKMVIYDSFMPWFLDVTKETGLMGAPFFTQSCVVNSIYYHFHKGALPIPLNGSLVTLPAINEFLRVGDLPSFISSPTTYPPLLRILLEQFSNFEEANCTFVNTVDKLEFEGGLAYISSLIGLAWLALEKVVERKEGIAMEGVENIEQKPTRGAHVLVIPTNLQGHINPMLQFSKRLASKGLQVTFILTSSSPCQSSLSSLPSVEFVGIFDGFREGHKINDFEAHIKRWQACITQSLLNLIHHYKQNKESLSPTPKMVIYDSFMPWFLDVTKETGLMGAPFFTQSCVVNSIYYHFHKGALSIPMNGSLVTLPAIKEFLRVGDLPSFISSPTNYPPLLRILLEQFSNFEQANCSFLNTVDKLENEVVDWMASKMPVKTIGPAIPSMYLDKRLPDDKDYGLSLFKPETDICIPWLDSKQECSVVYASMGSLASLGVSQMEEMALALNNSDKYFLWVVRASEEDKLPQGFKQRTSDKGLIVHWCPQLEVLAHPAVGCFVTHCGWNSTLEAISLGVPMVAFPQWTDQPTNAKCIADFWKVGVRVKADEKGIVTKEEMEFRIRQVMEGETGKEIRSNASKLQQVVRGAMEEGGSSDANIQEFVDKLLGSQLII